MCTTSQCRLRYPFQNLRVTNVIFIVTYYPLPPIESSPSFWMTRSQRSRLRDKGLWSVFWSGFGADFVRAYAPCRQGLFRELVIKNGAESASKHAPWKTGHTKCCRWIWWNSRQCSLHCSRCSLERKTLLCRCHRSSLHTLITVNQGWFIERKYYDFHSMSDTSKSVTYV